VDPQPEPIAREQSLKPVSSALRAFKSSCDDALLPAMQLQLADCSAELSHRKLWLRSAMPNCTGNPLQRKTSVGSSALLEGS
jgi:hypothetical protein